MLDSKVTELRFIRMETMMLRKKTGRAGFRAMHSSIRSTAIRFSKGLDRRKGVRTVVKPKGVWIPEFFTNASAPWPSRVC